MKRKQKLFLSPEDAARQREIARRLKLGLPLSGLLAAALGGAGCFMIGGCAGMGPRYVEDAIVIEEPQPDPIEVKLCGNSENTDGNSTKYEMVP